jgi:hypothetical protein
MAPFAPPFRDVRTLQYWWLGFMGLLLAGGLTVLGRNYAQVGSFGEALQWNRHFLHQVLHQLLVFTLLLVVSYTGRKAVWWLAISIITLKATFLVFYFTATNWGVNSSVYYEEFSYCCEVLHLDFVLGIFFSDPISLVTMLSLYAYWLLMCLGILRAAK